MLQSAAGEGSLTPRGRAMVLKDGALMKEEEKWESGDGSRRRGCTSVYRCLALLPTGSESCPGRTGDRSTVSRALAPGQRATLGDGEESSERQHASKKKTTQKWFRRR